MQLYPPKSPFVSPFWREKYDREANRYWDKFYKRNSDRFFKDRHYLDKEWGSYFQSLDSTTGTGVVLEVGCGAGNTVFPLLAEYPHLFMHACDFSPRAVQIVTAHSDYNSSRVNAFVCDATSDPLVNHVPPASVDIATLIFMLSAVSPEKMSAAIENIKSVLKPGGCILIRDYAAGDLAQERLKKRDQQISENFFVRGDGTRAYYFTEEFMKDLLERQGFVVESLDTVSKVVENRSRELVMDRRWIQGVFRLASTSKANESYLSVEAPEEFGVAEIFAEAPVVEETTIELGNSMVVHAKLISRSNQHTCKNTGLMLWESAIAMSQLLLRHPILVKNKSVLELGSGCVGLCSLVASLHASSVIATDGDTQALDQLRENLETNAGAFPVASVSCRKVTWGQEEDIAEVLQACSGGAGFQVIIGTDVTYVNEALGNLFVTAKAMISKEKELKPVLLLCHLARKANEDEIISTAGNCGFSLKHKWLSSDERVPFESDETGFHIPSTRNFTSTFLLFD